MGVFISLDPWRLMAPQPSTHIVTCGLARRPLQLEEMVPKPPLAAEFHQNLAYGGTTLLVLKAEGNWE